MKLIPLISERNIKFLIMVTKALCLIWSTSEVAFYLHMRRKLAWLNRRSKPDNPLPTPEARQAHMRRVVSFVVESGRCPTEYISEWFNGAPFSEIKMENLLEWAAASLFNKELPECDAKEREELVGIIRFIEGVTGIRAKPGHNPNVRSLRLTIDPLRVVHRPLIMYATIGVATHVVGRLLLTRLGFRLKTIPSTVPGKPDFTYWYRPGRPKAIANHGHEDLAETKPGEVTMSRPLSKVEGRARPPTIVIPDGLALHQAAHKFRPPPPSPTRSLFDYNPESPTNSESSSFDGSPRASSQSFRTAQQQERTTPAEPPLESSLHKSLRDHRPAGFEVVASRPSAAYGLSHSERVILAESEPGAVVFVHGIGVGVWTYYTLLARMVERYPYKDIFLPEFHHIAMRLEDRVPAPKESADNIRKMLALENHSCAVFMGHSYGTFVVGHCLRFQPKMVEHIVQVDPVCFLIHQMDGPFQFIFRKPECPETRIINFVAQTELNIVHTLARKLWWWENIIWEDHIPSGSSVILSAKDSIVPSAAVRAYLQHCAHRVRVLWWEHLSHAGFLLQKQAIDQVLDCIAVYWPSPQAASASSTQPEGSSSDKHFSSTMIRPVPHPRRLLAMLIARLQALQRSQATSTDHGKGSVAEAIQAVSDELDAGPTANYGYVSPQPLTLHLPPFALIRPTESPLGSPSAGKLSTPAASVPNEPSYATDDTPTGENEESYPELTLSNMMDVSLHRKRYEKAIRSKEAFRKLLKDILRLQRQYYGLSKKLKNHDSTERRDCLRTCVSACCVQQYFHVPKCQDDLVPSDNESEGSN